MGRTLVALTLFAAAAAVLAAGCGGSAGYGGGSPTTTTAPTTSAAGTPAGGTAVAINNFAFSPATLQVKLGQQVTWTNQQQGVTHTVTADGGTFDHPMPSGATFSFTFATAGSFAYHRKIHPSMHGTIVASYQPRPSRVQTRQGCPAASPLGSRTTTSTLQGRHPR
jgi:plastocyanin